MGKMPGVYTGEIPHYSNEYKFLLEFLYDVGIEKSFVLNGTHRPVGASRMRRMVHGDMLYRRNSSC